MYRLNRLADAADDPAHPVLDSINRYLPYDRVLLSSLELPVRDKRGGRRPLQHGKLATFLLLLCDGGDQGVSFVRRFFVGGSITSLGSPSAPCPGCAGASACGRSSAEGAAPRVAGSPLSSTLSGSEDTTGLG